MRKSQIASVPAGGGTVVGGKVVGRRVTGKILLISVATSVVLFAAAAPFGQDHHGIGMVLSDILWPLFLISVVLLIILALVAVVQRVMTARTNRR